MIHLRTSLVGKSKDRVTLSDYEATLRLLHDNIVQGGIEWHTEGPYKEKATVLIRCDCGETRRVATSDLPQVSKCPICIRNGRNARRRVARSKERVVGCP